MIRELRLISKFMTLQPWKQATAMHILPNISRNKCDKTMKLGQLIEYNMRNIFLEKSMWWKNYSQTLLTFWVCLWINRLKFNTVCFFHMLSWGLSKLLKLSCRRLSCTLYEAWYLKKNIFCLLTDLSSLSSCLYFIRY